MKVRQKPLTFQILPIHGDLKPMTFILDTNVLHELGHLYLGQLGQLQEYQRALVTKLRLAAQDLQLLDLLDPAAGSGSFLTAATILADSEAGDLDESTTIDVSSPSLHLPSEQTLQFGRTVYDEFCALVAESARYVLARVSRHKHELRRVNAVIAILQEAGRSTISLFCSVRWERRRWFLHHGARPPKQTAQAILGLFAGACSSPLIAY